LLIVIGNPTVLSVDSHWKQFIDYCMDQKAYIGVKPLQESPSGPAVVLNEILQQASNKQALAEDSDLSVADPVGMDYPQRT